MVVDLEYLYRRILGDEGEPLPGEGQNLGELVDHAASWSSELAEVTGDLTEAAEAFEAGPVYLTEGDQARLAALLHRAAELTDDAASAQLTDLAYDTHRYTSRKRAMT